MIISGIFTKSEYSHACRLQASLTRSAQRMRTQFALQGSTNKNHQPRECEQYELREVGFRPHQLRQNEKRPSKTVFLVEAAGLEPTVSSTRSRKNVFFEHHCLHIVRIFRKIISFCTFVPFIPYRTFLVVVSYVVKPRRIVKSGKRRARQSLFSPINKPYPC